MEILLVSSDLEGTQEVLLSFLVLLEVRMEHPQVVEDPRHPFLEFVFLELAQAGPVTHQRPVQVSLDVCEHPEVLLHHAGQPVLPGTVGSASCLPVETLCSLHISPALCDDG